MKKRMIVSMLLVLGLLVIMTGSAFAFANMGPYNSSCDSCHGKTASLLPEQKPAAPAPAPKPATAPKPAAKPAVTITTVDFTIFNRTGKAEVITENGVTYVAVRSLAELYKTFAAYDDVAMVFTLKTPDFTLSGTDNSKNFTVNGKAAVFGNPLKKHNNRVYVDVASLGKALGGEAAVTATKVTVSVPMSGLEVLVAITDEWRTSGKQFGIASTFTRGLDCAKCHDGYGFREFETYKGDPTTYKPEHMTGIDCAACHTGYGKKLMDTGVVELPFADKPYQAGKAALCLACHNSNRVPVDLFKQSKERKLTRLSYPHYGMQGALMTGAGGMEIPGITYKSTAAHVNIKDSCITCHMPKTKEGYMQHTFGMDTAYIYQQCGVCHPGAKDYNYKGLQTEIKGMLDKLYAAILKDTGADKVTMSGGAFHFHKGEATIPVADISHEAYVAVYNWRVVKYDASYGVHNPAYAKQLLRESYKLLTGQNL